jgi:GTPase
MADSNFIDYVKIYCSSGKGGAGSVHFYRDKITAKGGPDGGNGGRGGHIILKGNSQLWTLLNLKYNRHFKAEHGISGSSNNKTGAEGEDIYIDVPLGTIVRNAETKEFMMEITKHAEEKILLRGGRGGMGNTNFKSSTMQTPRFAQPGEPLQEGWFILELKILADVGLVGFPNAGKSTLLSVVSDAKPKIADYPFTTLVPNLGIVKIHFNYSFIMADIPGIIEGASQGKGLGVRFLKHIERNSILLFLVPADSDDIFNEYHILLNELKQFNPELLDKKRILAISKSDLVDKELLDEIEKNLPEIPYIFISSYKKYGLEHLKNMLWESLNES